MKSTDNVSKHFKLYEVERSSIAERLEIDNHAPTWVIENAMELGTHIMDPMREHWDIPYGPNSWFRCQELEKALTWEKGFRHWCAKYRKPWLSQKNMYREPIVHNGVDKSWAEYFARKQHPTGKASDNEIPGVSNDEIFFWIRDNLAFDQLIREFPKPSDPTSGWVHVSWAGVQENRQTSFSIPYYDKYA